MSECPLFYREIGDILLVPSPLGERDRVRGDKRKNLRPLLFPPPQGGGCFLKQARCPALWAGSFTNLKNIDRIFSIFEPVF